MPDIKSFLLTVGKMLLMNLPFILLCLRARKVNLDKTWRSKQFFAPVFAVIYVIVACIFLNKLNAFLVEKIQGMTEWLSTLAGVNGLPKEANEVIAELSKKLSTFMKGLRLDFWVCFISNTVIMAVFLVIKRFVIAVSEAVVKNKGRLHTRIAENFYDYHEEKDVWCVRNRLVQARTLLGAFYIAAIVLTIILMMVSRPLYLKELLKTVFYPVFSVIFVGELYFYLKGISWVEYLQTIDAEEEDSVKTVNYSLLRKALRVLFGDKLLADNTVVNNTLASSATNDEIFEKLDEEMALAGHSR